MKKVSLKKIKEILSMPLNDLIFKAQTVHKKSFPKLDIQLASLLSIKTGSCPEDCKYCPQSAHYNVGLKKEKLINIDLVEKAARKAKENGADRFCMGAAWKKLNNGKDLELVIKMIKTVKSLDLEACVTLGSITKEQALTLKKAGLDAYNHNIDTSPEFYKEIISTRTFEERLDTIKNVQRAGISVCSGGIIGMGESWHDRARMIEVLANLSPQPESIPINSLVPVEGTPLEDMKKVDSFEMVRIIAAIRIILPKSRIRLSAGRKDLTKEAQLLCFIVGANSIFYGDTLLTTDNNDMKGDKELIAHYKESAMDIINSNEL